MAIQFACPACGKTLSVPEAVAGKKTKCPACGGISPAPHANAATAGGSATSVPAPGTQPSSGASQHSSSRPGHPAAAAASAGSANSLPPLPKTRAITANDPSGMGGLLQELTKGDLQTHAEKLALEEKKDPLAPYLTNWRKYRDGLPPVGPRPIAIWLIAAIVALFGLLHLAYAGSAAHRMYQAKGWGVFSTLGEVTIALGLVTAVAVVALLVSFSLLSQSESGWWFSQVMFSSYGVTKAIAIYQAAQAAQPMAMMREGMMIMTVLISIATIAYLNYLPVRTNFRVKHRVWLGPLVAIPLGIALEVGLRYGLPELIAYAKRQGW